MHDLHNSIIRNSRNSNSSFNFGSAIRITSEKAKNKTKDNKGSSYLQDLFWETTDGEIFVNEATCPVHKVEIGKSVPVFTHRFIRTYRN